MTHTHLHSQFPFQKPNAILDVMLMYSNPIRWHSRARLFQECRQRIEATPHTRVSVVEVAFGERPFEVTSGQPRELQLRTHDELWHKENALNLLAQRLPSDFKYVCWLDGDIMFDSHPDTWAMETIHQLQHYQVVQMFTQALDLGVHGDVMHLHKGFVSSWRAKHPYSRQYGAWHPGYGWAFTRSAWNGLGGLIDHAILGSGDDHMAKCLIGKPEDSYPEGLHHNYIQIIESWAKRAAATIKYDIGHLPTVIKHFFHGNKVDRQYWSRWDYLKKAPGKEAFDPLTDIKRDWQGLYQLTDAKLHLRDGIREYHRNRNEDANT